MPPGSVCPSPAPPTAGEPCTIPGELDCHYEREHDCCGNCAQNFTVSCVPDNSTTGAGLWQISSPPCPAESADCCGSEGVVTSPNYPDNYPDNLQRTETIIEVQQGLILSLEFTAFDVYTYYSNCYDDHLTITDGDGTTLMEKSCGPTSDGNILIGDQSISSSLPPNITSTSNIVKLVFITDDIDTSPGWSVSWSAVTPGSVCPSLAPTTPGQHCTLPGELDCHYEREHDCCGNCAQNFTVSCVPDNSTTGAGLWQISSPPCPTESADCCGSEGEVTSPNYPNDYPNNLNETETIKVQQGLILSLQFTAFDVLKLDPTCDNHHLTITDGNGTTLMEKSCGSSSDGNILIEDQSISSSLPPNITSTSNIVKLVFSTFYTDYWGFGTRSSGWSVSWSAVTPGVEADKL